MMRSMPAYLSVVMAVFLVMEAVAAAEPGALTPDAAPGVRGAANNVRPVKRKAGRSERVRTTKSAPAGGASVSAEKGGEPVAAGKGGAVTSEDKAPAPSAGEEPALQVSGGEYRGVRPGKTWLPPNPPPPAERPLLTWAGFMMTDTGSRVFVQLTKPAEYQVVPGAKGIVVVVRGAKIYKRNNARPVNTSHFPTPVVRVHAKQHGKDVRVIIDTRERVTPQHHMEEGEGGYRFIMLDFPKGAATEATPRTESGKRPEPNDAE